MSVDPTRRKIVFGTIGVSLLGSRVAQSRALELAAADERLAEPLPNGATTVRMATLRDGDPIHRGSGSARLLKLPDGGHVVRLENLEVVPGPNLFVYLVAHEDPLFPEDVTDGFQNLGLLKSRFGDQNYPVPQTADPAAYGSVVVWCDTFKTQFAVASLG
ncbi:MAG: DM13 domain-containing protein [Alphaproteobacteria bacterium]|nr:DM13 domain-containing protein [Alphaproteobacteria bacterium]